MWHFMYLWLSIAQGSITGVISTWWVLFVFAREIQRWGKLVCNLLMVELNTDTIFYSSIKYLTRMWPLIESPYEMRFLSLDLKKGQLSFLPSCKLVTGLIQSFSSYSSVGCREGGILCRQLWEAVWEIWNGCVVFNGIPSKMWKLGTSACLVRLLQLQV